ncbi:hypothetical protein [Sporisorium scitamineum]|uniref:Uncharacterized protein n=2 Tax=Sporisorium scitamineum TaxID=49012 RepID=A0A0F7S758_9BASI|nr:hypothetical protein [Sporisorium scitamineum]
MARADAVVQDPMEAQANSFGWLAIRNFTYCLSSNPDPPNKPRGVQPKQSALATTGSDKPTTKTGMGDSVVVLYHPEITNKAIAWCNTLVAFQSTEHVQCHIALPTCQRCEAVRSKDGSRTTDAGKDGGQVEKGSKAPSGKLGQPKTRKDLIDADGAHDAFLPLRRRGAGASDPNDPLIALPGGSDPNAKPQLQTQPQPQPQPQTQPQPAAQPATEASSSTQPNTQPKSTASRPYDSSVTVDVDASSDPELEAAISEFQDYCENKLTLAVRADCPLHIVKNWTDEPPFDLHRFCMSLRGTDGYTLHTPNSPSTSLGNLGVAESNPGGQPGGDAKSSDGKEAGSGSGSGSAKSRTGQSTGNDKGKGSDGGDKTGAGESAVVGALDPNDPLVPYPQDKDQSAAVPQSPPPTQPNVAPVN